MAYDFSKLVKKNNKIILNNSRAVVYFKPDIILPVNTLRFVFESSTFDPTTISNGGTWTRTSNTTDNEWDWYCADTNWDSKFEEQLKGSTKKCKIIAGNAENVTSMKRALAFCNLTDVTIDNLGNVTDMSSCFNSSEITNLKMTGIKKLTNMSGMFIYCENLTNLYMDDTSTVTNMSSLLAYTSMKQNLNVLKLNTHGVTNISYMFSGPVAYLRGNVVNDILSDVSNVTEAETINEYNDLPGAYELYLKLSATGKVVQTNFKTFWSDGLSEEDQERIPQEWRTLLI